MPSATRIQEQPGTHPVKLRQGRARLCGQEHQPVIHRTRRAGPSLFDVQTSAPVRKYQHIPEPTEHVAQEGLGGRYLGACGVQLQLPPLRPCPQRGDRKELFCQPGMAGWS